MKQGFLLPLLIMVVLFASLHGIGIAGTTGKIAGTITDKSTGQPIVGATVLVVGTTLGAATDLNGEFTILDVTPGTYSVQVSSVGYAKVIVTDVVVHIDQTARVDVALGSESIQMKETVVEARRSVVKPDVSTSVVAVTNNQIARLPVTSVQSVVALQAGVTGDLQIRGGSPSDALFLVDGITLRDPRNNQPITGIPLSSVKEVSLERGGFNAEYGQVRSGIVNVVTRDGGKSSYSGLATIRYSPYSPKFMGISPFDKNSYWMRPYLDPAVCWTGTANGAWDAYTRAQYPSFNGWNALSQQLNSDNDPTNDLSPEALQKLFLFQTRKQLVTEPDYTVDAGFGGPVPLIGQELGDLRFYGSYRRDDQMLLVPMTRDDNLNWDWNLRLNSNPVQSLKLAATILAGTQFTEAQNWSMGQYINTPQDVAAQIAGDKSVLFSTGYFSPATINYTSFALQATQFLSEKTYYNVRVERLDRRYDVTAPPLRDTSAVYEIVPGYYVDEAPFGYSPVQSSSYTGIQFGGASAKARDNSVVSATSVKADLTSQVDFRNLVKTGIEFVYNDLNLNYGQVASLSNGEGWDNHVMMHVFPITAAAYIQDKLETNGFVANMGVRADYSNSQAAWFDGNAFDRLFFSSAYNPDSTFPVVNSKPQLQISPRLGISHPITETTKLYFNYGWFKEMPSYQQLFTIDRGSNGTMNNFGNPDLTLARTVAYELGFDYSVSDNYLVQLSGFYRDISYNQNSIAYYSASNWSYNESASTGYADVRGFELTVRKNWGRFWTAFANYTYQSSSSGHFGSLRVYQDPTSQITWDENTTNLYQNVVTPSPYARVNVTVFTPENFGPRWGTVHPLGEFSLNVLFNWQSGSWITYNPLGVDGISNNVQTTDFLDTQLRLSKAFTFGTFKLEFFADVFNAFNYKYMNLGGCFSNTDDQNSYYSSLHLPRSNAYNNIPGSDKIGDYRLNGAAYQPMVYVASIDPTTKGDAGVIYYDNATGKYEEFVNGIWGPVNASKLDNVLKNKAYIDMPNLTSFTFLDPRQIFFGINLSFNI